MSNTIALVDDDRNLLTSISIALEREGFKVQTYIDGETAFIGLTRNPPDLAIIDIKLDKANKDCIDLLNLVTKKKRGRKPKGGKIIEKKKNIVEESFHQYEHL